MQTHCGELQFECSRGGAVINQHRIVAVAQCVFLHQPVRVCVKVCRQYAYVRVHECRSLRAVSLSLNLKWAESNQRSQQDPALSLPPLPLSHLRARLLTGQEGALGTC